MSKGKEFPPEELCLRMEVEGLKIVSTGGNGRFVIGEKARYYSEERLSEARSQAYAEGLEELSMYGEHCGGCTAWNENGIPDGECNCGFRAALKDLEAKAAEGASE